MLIIGHRGCAYEPENTLRSFQKALALGVDMIELDVHASKDGYLMVIHDDTLDRMTNGHGLVSSYTKEELQHFTINGVEYIPTLDVVYNLIGSQARINIEVKAHQIEELVVDFIKNRKGYERVLVSSFNHRALKKIKLLEKRVQTGVLVYGIPYNLSETLRYLRAAAYHADKDFLLPEDIELVHTIQKKVYVYTINESDDINRFRNWHVDGIISDYPDRVRKAMFPE